MNISIPYFPESMESSIVDQPPRNEPCNEIRFNAVIAQKELLFKHVDEFLRRISDNITAAESEEKHKKIIDAKELKKTIEDFKNFFEDYFKFFETGDRSEYQKRMSCECVLSRALTQIRSIWTRLSWAVNQRFIDVYEEKLKELSKEADSLMSLAPELFDKTQRCPIIYLDKFIHITRYTYPTSPLIGVSIDRTIEESRLSLAHELGHHVFWNSGNLEEYSENINFIHNIIFKELEFDKVKDDDHKRVVRATKANLEMFEVLKSWSEEIVADIFATLLTGAEYAKSCQDILARDSIFNIDDCIENDGKHPIPKLRPHVPLKVLKIIVERKKDKEGDTTFVKELDEVIEKLEKRWKNFTRSNKNIHIGNMPDWEIKQLETHLLNIVGKIVVLPLKIGESLMELVPYYWGSGKYPEKEKDDLDKLINKLDLDEDFLIKPPSPAVKKANRKLGANELETDEYGDDFKEFLNYIKSQNEKYGNKKSVWENMLSLKLTQTDYLSCTCWKDINGRLIGDGCK